MQPVAESVRARIRALHAEGMSRNAIARESGVSTATVTKVIKASGGSFDRSATEAAVNARVVDLRKQRADIVTRLYARSRKVLERLEADEYSYRLAIPGSKSELVSDDHPPAVDERNLSSSIMTYLQAASKLELQDSDSAVSSVVSMIERVASAFGVSDA